MQKEPAPLYRKINKKAYGAHYLRGGHARYDRNTKEGISRSMKKGVRRGLDYSPLYMFLLSKVGCKWPEVHSEAVSRLPKRDTILEDIFKPGKRAPVIWGGGSAMYTGMFIDENDILRTVTPEVKNEELVPQCGCCTNTYNGRELVRKYDPNLNNSALFEKYKDSISNQ